MILTGVRPDWRLVAHTCLPSVSPAGFVVGSSAHSYSTPSFFLSLPSLETREHKRFKAPLSSFLILPNGRVRVCVCACVPVVMMLVHREGLCEAGSCCSPKLIGLIMGRKTGGLERELRALHVSHELYC